MREESMNVTDTLLAMRAELASLTDKILLLKNLESDLKTIAGGKLPSVLSADGSLIDGMESPDIDDETFVKLLASALSKREGVERMIDLATLAARIVVERDRIDGRLLKLTSRISKDGESAERATAKTLRFKIKLQNDVLGERLSKVLDRFFEARLKTLNAVSKMTSHIVGLFKGGDEMLRTAALRNDARGAITDIADSDAKSRAGKMTITTTGKRRVKI